TNTLPGANGPTLQLSNLQPSQAGSYTVLVTNDYGSILSSNALLTANPPPPCLTPASGLVSWWSGEGSTVDIVGGNNGSLMNGASFGAGRVGQAFSFNGINQQVIVPDSPELDPTNALTLETWVYLRTLPSVNAVTVVGKDNGSSARQLQLGIGDLGGGFT